jgi:hypothetical protein
MNIIIHHLRTTRHGNRNILHDIIGIGSNLSNRLINKRTGFRHLVVILIES